MLKIPVRLKQRDFGVSFALDYCECIVNMGTRAAAFTVKIRSLYDYHLRLMHGVMPPPSGVDIANTIKYFSQTLLTVLKDVPNSPLELLKDPEKDSTRMSLFPNLDYKGLYNSLIPLIETAPLIQNGAHAFGQAVLQCLGCLLPFLESETIDSLPYLTASCIAVFPNTLHQEIVNTLCFYVLPFTVTRYTERENEIIQSVSAVIMMIFNYSSNPAHHCQLLECLMALKQSVLKDLLCVIAYGTSSARLSAAKLLFYYWPAFDPNLFDRKGLICKLGGDPAPFVCQRDMCPNAGNAEAAKVCYDHCIAITFANDVPPPLYLCIECANEIHREHPDQNFYDILHPVQQVSMVCENKNCRSIDKSAVSVCFSIECASYNGNRPIRYCQQCHNNRHNNRRGGDHIFHKSVPPTWSLDEEMQTYMVEAIISLLKESKLPTSEPKFQITGLPITGDNKPITLPQIPDNITSEERQLLGRYGVWLLVGRCTPKESTPIEVMGRLLSMLFHWFHMTAYSYDGQESTLEKLKTENVCGWLKELCKTHYELFISCLLPHPPDYARIGGHWDMLASRTTHLKDGLNRLFYLVPYEVINQGIWDFVMPHWMEAIVNDVPEKELQELKIILSKILDTDMNPLGFNAQKMYNFVSVCFQKTPASVQRKALKWLQVLSTLEIVIPLYLLFSIFRDGVRTLKSNVHSDTSEKYTEKTETTVKLPTSPVLQDCDSGNTSVIEDDNTSFQKEGGSNSEQNLFCCVLMLDILLKQMELQDVDKHTGINSTLCKDVCRLLKCMITATWISSHKCSVKMMECSYCEASVMWHQLCLKLIQYLSPEKPAHPPDPPLEEYSEDYISKSPPESSKKEAKSDVIMSVPIPEAHSIGGVLVHMPHVCSVRKVPLQQIMTATVETVSEQLDLAAIIPAEKVVTAMAKAITMSDSDSDPHTKLDKKVSNDDCLSNKTFDDGSESVFDSDGKLKFSIDELPEQLQYIYYLFSEVPKVGKSEILYYMLQCLNIFCLHGDACTKASKEHKAFFKYCQQNLLIKNLWDLCNSEHSHIAQEAVPLLLHCITLPFGADVFWKIIQEDFHSIDWRVRFIAVDRVTMIARYLDSAPLRNMPALQAALANAFCYLITSMDDCNVYVAQRATLYLGTIHDAAIRLLIICLETQFDTVIIDRPMILQSLYQLHNSLSERKILTWEFFLNRFDTLFLEAQINLERSGDISYLRDLRNSDMNSDIFIKKLHRAQEALSQQSDSGASSVKTLSASFGTKWPYKRTMSAPASIISRHDTKEIKEKVYSRQFSAPILKRKSSRFGIGQFLGTSNSIPDGHMHSLNLADDQNFVGILHRIIDLEEADKETMHLLVFLLMQFLSRSDQAYPTENKYVSRSQGILLRHLYLLLGYSQNDRGIYISPQRLRASPAFCAFLSNLPQLLDQNHLIGHMLLPTTMILLQYAASPHYVQNSIDLQQPTYSLWALEPHSRRCWLMSVVVLLYKYQYNHLPHCTQLSFLIKIILNTLDAQHHQCCRLPATIIMGGASSRSRDVSQPSLGTEYEHGDKFITPPLSPMYSLDGQSVQISASSRNTKIQSVHAKIASGTSMETHWEETTKEVCNKREKNKKKIEESFDLDDSESELLVIPESDGSDSTLQGSVHSSLEMGDDNYYIQAKESKKCYQETIESIERVNIKRSRCLIKKSVAENRPTWYIGSQEEFVKANGNRKETAHKPKESSPRNYFSTDQQNQVHRNSNSNLSVSKPTANGLHHQNNHIMATVASELYRKNGEYKTSACTSSSESENCSKENENFPYLATPSLERLLPIGSRLADARSPDSPLSKMDIMPVDSPKEVMCYPSLDSHLEIPSQERLLPIGPHSKDITHLVDRMKQVLKINNQVPKISESQKISRKGSGKEEFTKNHSPRRLIKQVALESPPGQGELFANVLNSNHKKDAPINQRRIRRGSPLSPTSYRYTENKLFGSWVVSQQSSKTEGNEMKQSSFRTGDECISERCSECGIAREEYSDEELGLCIVALGTFIHREPASAAPLLPEILHTVAKVATHTLYPWQNESNVHLPGSAVSVAHQFLRCVLHQLAPNGIFTQMFQTRISEKIRTQFFKSVVQALMDFTELNPIAPLQLLLEMLNSKKTWPIHMMPIILQNMSIYLECMSNETNLFSTNAIWCNTLPQLEIFFRRVLIMLSHLDDVTPILRIIISILKVSAVSQHKGILEPFTKILSYTIQRHTFRYSHLVDLCHLCNKAFTKDRDKLIFSRTMAFELMQALKFKMLIPDTNLLMLINLVLQDTGGLIPVNTVLKEKLSIAGDGTFTNNTNISECMKVHLTDLVDFLTDFHTLAKMKSYCKGINIGLNEDTIGGIIKGAVAQYIAIEIAKGNGKENRAVTRYFPWLYGSSNIQQTPREFIECITHIRLLSWLLLGSLTYCALRGFGGGNNFFQPIPQETSCQIADHVQIIMSGFAEQHRSSVLHMSSLFHTFILCQLWTIYLEQSLSAYLPISEAYNTTMNILFDFWGKVMPSILQLVQHSRVLNEIVSLHFLNTLEALLECNSTIVSKLMPLWTSVLCSNNLPGHLQVRLQNCHNFIPSIYLEVLPNKSNSHLNNPVLLKWLQRLQFKMGQIELQSSTATHFYSL